MIRRLFKLFILILSVFPLMLHAQDAQFSQFYAAPLYLNPALAGSAESSRIGANYRYQWPATEASFVTYSAFGDTYFARYNSGLGFFIMNDIQGQAGLRSTSINVQYSYNLYLSPNLGFRAGFNASLFNTSLDFSRLRFPDQFGGGGFTGNPSQEPIGDFGSRFYGSLGTGGLLYGRNFWLGLSAHHLNVPNVSFISGADRLPIKASLHGGYRFLLGETDFKGRPAGGKERSLTPTFNFKKQGRFDQLDIGTYVTLEPLVLGAWYRGVPGKNTPSGAPNSESIVTLVGFVFPTGLQVGYSFDYTISALGITAGGAHEISVIFNFMDQNKRRPDRSMMSIPCPKF